ncbi:MAG TPA: hypothetical protein PLQ89_21750, partial [Phycisphaerae bacterium]|nr:hypothetical protein [Phycisphaerae bacterium]
GEFRVTSWRLNKDFSIDIQGRTTTDSMYDLVAGPKPADVEASPVPIEPDNLVPGHVQPIGAEPFLLSKVEDGVTVTLAVEYDPPADMSVFAGVTAHVEAPDESRVIALANDYDYNGDATAEAGTAARHGTCELRLPQPSGGNETWRVYLTPRSRAYKVPLVFFGEPNASPSATIEINQATGIAAPPRVASVTLAEKPASRRLVQNDDGAWVTLFTLQVTVELKSDPLPNQWVAIELSRDDKEHWDGWTHDREITSKTQTFDIDLYVPAAGNTFWARAWSRIPGYPGSAAEAIESESGVYIPPHGLPSPYSVKDATVVVRERQTVDGLWLWGGEVSFRTPTPEEEPNFFHATVWIQWVDENGDPDPNYLGEWRQVAEPGKHVTLAADVDWLYPAPGTRYRIPRYSITVHNRAGDKVKQFCWPGGADHFDVSLPAKDVAPAADLIQNARVSHVTYTKQDNGQYQFSFQIEFDAADDTNFWAVESSVQLVTADGMPCPEEPNLAQERFGITPDFAGHAGGHRSVPIGPWWVPPAEWTGRTHRLRLYAKNRNGVRTVQKWPNGKTYFDLTPEVKYWIGGNYPNIPAPNVVQFDIGTQNPDGTFVRAPHWDVLNEKMIFDWAAFLPEDVSNLGYVKIWFQRNGVWIESPMVYEGIAPGALIRDSFTLTGDQIPQPGEQITFICSSANKLGIVNQNPPGTPTGPSVTVTITAPNKGIGADNLNPGLIGGGLGMGSGKVFVKPGNGLLIDWSGAVVPNIQTGGGIGLNDWGQFYVPLGAISSANLASGTLGDLSKYTADKRPIVVSYGTPALPHPDFPVGSVVMNMYDGKLYRNEFGQWTKDADPADLIAGTLAAGVVYSGRIAASQIDAGTITVGSGGLHFSGEGGIWIMNGGNVVVSPGRIVTQTGALFKNVLYGFEIIPAPSASIIQGLTMDTQVKVGHYYIGDREVINAYADADVNCLKINGTTVIDSSRNLINVTLERVNKLIVNDQHISGDV